MCIGPDILFLLEKKVSLNDNCNDEVSSCVHSILLCEIVLDRRAKEPAGRIRLSTVIQIGPKRRVSRFRQETGLAGLFKDMWSGSASCDPAFWSNENGRTGNYCQQSTIKQNTHKASANEESNGQLCACDPRNSDLVCCTLRSIMMTRLCRMTPKESRLIHAS